MLRFTWLILTLAGWGYMLLYLPRMPTWLVGAAIVLSIIGYLYGWARHKRNWLICFFTALPWSGIWCAIRAIDWWSAYRPPFPIPIPAESIGKVILLISLLLAGFLTFANYRVSLNFMHRRGNIEKEQLVRLHPENSLFKAVREWFKKRRNNQEITLTLGKEIPFKDD